MDTSNDNIRKLYEMLDNPTAYSEQEIHDIIDCDEESRETYRMMVEIKRSNRWKKPQQPVDVDAAWCRFDDKHYPQRSGRYWMRVAASFIGILFISGIAFAILHIMQGHSVESQVTQTEERDMLQLLMVKLIMLQVWKGLHQMPLLLIIEQ